MGNSKLRQIRDSLYMLPVLREKHEKINLSIRETERNVEQLLKKYEQERVDVEQLKNNSLSAVLLKLIGKYEDRLEKEKREVLAAKVEYDKAVAMVKELSYEREEIEKRISALEQDKRMYEAEIDRREKEILSADNEKSREYKRLVEEQDTIGRQLAEMDEAIRAANRTDDTIRNAISHLDSADGWATFDVWTRGGIFSHMAKYDHIDKAESCYNRLSSQLQELRKELSDIQIFNVPELDVIDSATRTIDIWLDNIFTDLAVRDRIRSNMEKMRNLSRKIAKIVSHINDNKSEMNKRYEEIENRKNELLISM